MGRGCRTHGRSKRCIKYVGRINERKRPRGRTRRRSEDNIRMDFKKWFVMV
jgi:hypothetical protein